jgi:hypothetical protein
MTKSYVVKTQDERYVEHFDNQTGEMNTVESIFDAARYTHKVAWNIAYKLSTTKSIVDDEIDKYLVEYTYNHDARECFGLTNEEYIGSWFGHDVYRYEQFKERMGLLATEGSEGGEYSTLIFDRQHLYGTIGDTNGKSISLAEHMTTCSRHKAFLMAAMAIFLSGRPQ